jgi:lipoate-protein ligase B
VKDIIAKYHGTIPYIEGIALQKKYHSDVLQGDPNTLLLMQHPNVYTLGRRGKNSDILIDEETLASLEIDTYHTDRGGEVTYHGPGQIIAYPIINIKKMDLAPTDYVNILIIGIENFLSAYGVYPDKRTTTGVWVKGEKIASLGIKVSKGITTHGLALNINPELNYFDHIIACGTKNSIPTSLSKILNHSLTIDTDICTKLAKSIGESLGLKIYWQC